MKTRALYEKLPAPYATVVENTPLRVLGYAHHHPVNILFIGNATWATAGHVDEQTRIRGQLQHSGETIRPRGSALPGLRR